MYKKQKLKDDINFLKDLRTHSVLGEMNRPSQQELNLEEELYQLEKSEEFERNKYSRNFTVEEDGY